MDALIVFAVILLAVVSSIGKATRKMQGYRPGTRRPTEMPEVNRAPENTERHMDPVNAVLPGQTTLYTQRDMARSQSGDASVTESYMAYTPIQPQIEVGATDTMETFMPYTPAGQRMKPQVYGAKSAEHSAEPVRVEGLDIAFDRDSLVRGVIFSEILNRRVSRRPHR